MPIAHKPSLKNYLNHIRPVPSKIDFAIGNVVGLDLDFSENPNTEPVELQGVGTGLIEILQQM